MSSPLPGWPQFDDEEIAAVTAVMKSGRVNYWTGREGRSFETEYAAHCGVRFAVAVANGSVALECALHALGIGPGDEVIVTPRSFFASAACVVLAGATPVFADVDRVSQNIRAESIRAVLTEKSRAIVCVHLSGWPCEMKEIMDLAKEYDLAVIEDCAQAHGSRIHDRPVGSWGDIGVFSFCQDKIISTGGEGGMLVTDDPELWQRIWSRKDHGKNFELCVKETRKPGFRWLHDSFGTNFRMTEMQAAIGRYQLTKLRDWVDRRRRNARILERALRDFDCMRVVTPPDHVFHPYYKYDAFVRVDELRKGWNRDKIIGRLCDRGVAGRSGSCPEIYREQAFVHSGLGPKDSLPVAKELGATSIQFLVHPTLGTDHMAYICQVVAAVLREAQM